MRDPGDDEPPGPAPGDIDSGDTGWARDPDEQIVEEHARTSSSDRDASQEADVHVQVRARPALSDEIARRWDPGQLRRMVSRGAGTGSALDATTRAHFERRLGADLGGVRVYTGEFAERVTAQHRAEAVTVGGTGMILMSGSPDRSPATAAGRALLAHELTHVAQSTRGLYRSAPGERPPLATEEHEAEAEAVEAAELADAFASGAALGGLSGLDREKAEEQLLEVVTARVVELVYEDERVHKVRNGEARFRP